MSHTLHNSRKALPKTSTWTSAWPVLHKRLLRAWEPTPRRRTVLSCSSCSRALPWAVKSSATPAQLSAQPPKQKHTSNRPCLTELFGEEPDLELEQDLKTRSKQEEPQAQAPTSVHTCSLQSLRGVLRAGPTSSGHKKSHAPYPRA